MPPITLKPVGDWRGFGSIYRVRSVSNPMGYHFVCVILDQSTDPISTFVECSCTGFQMHKHCWHEEKVVEWENAREVTTDDNVVQLHKHFIPSED